MQQTGSKKIIASVKLKTSMPETWHVRYLSDSGVAQIKMGQSPASSTYNCEGQGLPFYQGKTDFGLRHPRTRIWCNSPTRCADKGDILMSVRAPVGDVNIATEPCCIGRGLAAISAGPECDEEYVYYLLHANKERINSLGSGAIFRAINRDTLRRLEFQFPPRSEQRAIADVLSKIQRAVELEEKRIAALKELKAATMAKVFREGLRGERLKKTGIGEIPESWEMIRIGDIAAVGNGSTPSRTTPEYWNWGTMPWITSGKVHETFICGAEQFVTPKAQEACHLPLVPKGSVVVAITGQGKTLGNAALLRIDTFVNQHLAFLTLHGGKMLPDFLLFYLQYRYMELRSAASGGGTTKAALTCGFLKQYRVPIPRIEEQEEIARLLSSLAERVEQAGRKQRSLSQFFASALNQLIAGRLRVLDLLD